MTIHPAFETSKLTPVMKAFMAWREGYVWANSGVGVNMTDDEFNGVCDGLQALRNAVFGLPSESPADTLAKLVAFTDNGSDILVGGVKHEKAFAAEVAAVVDGVIGSAQPPVSNAKAASDVQKTDDVSTQHLRDRFNVQRQEMDDAFDALSDIRNMVCALDVLCLEFLQMPIEHDTGLERIRSGISGLSDALSERIRALEHVRATEGK